MTSAIMDRPIGMATSCLPPMPARQLLRYVRSAQRLGARLPMLFEAMGVSEADLRHPDGVAPAEMMMTLIAACRQEIGDPLTPLRLGEASVPQTFSDLNFGALFLPNLGAALASSIATQFQMNQRFTVEVERGDKTTTVSLREMHNRAEPPLEITLVSLGLYFSNIAAAGLQGGHFSEIYLPGPERPEAEAMAAWLNCPIHFGAEHNKVVIANSLLDQPLPRANRHVVRLYDAMMESLANEKSDILRACRLYLYEEMDKSPPTLARTAQALDITERTLRRRIREEGTTFRAVIEGIRKHLCNLYLAENSRSIEEIAQLLGYSETSAFTRAHMRWYGTPPSRARRPISM